MMRTEWSTFVTKPVVVRAYYVLEPHIVRCYNGDRMAQRGQYVVIDEDDQVMVMKKEKFERIYKEMNDGNLHQHSSSH